MRDIKNCLLCGSKTHIYEDSYYKCSNCNLIFKDPHLFVSLEKEKARYLTHNNSPEDQGYLKYLNKLFSCVDVHEGKILDYGCGPTKGLEALVKSKNLSKLEVESYDPIFFPEKNSEKNQKYDFIFASECFEHFYDPKKEIENILKLLNSKGSLLISTELSDGKSFKNWWYLKDPTHVVFYSLKTFKWLADRYNLDVLLLKSPHIVLKSKDA